MSDLRTAAHLVLEAYDAHDPLTIVMEDLRAALDKHDQSRVWIEERKAQLAKDKEITQRNASEESERIRQANEDGRCWACGKTKVDSDPIAKLPPEAQTEAEKIAYCAGWWDALAKKRLEEEKHS